MGDNYNFFKPGFTLDELQEVPRIYRSIIEDPLLLQEYFERDTVGVWRCLINMKINNYCLAVFRAHTIYCLMGIATIRYRN